MKFDAQKIRKDFPVLSQTVHGNPLVYLDNGATTLKPDCVIKAVEEHYQEYTANIHRGVHTLSQKATDRYEQARVKLQKFINAKESKEIILTKGATDSLNLVAYSYGRKFLTKGDEIIISHMEHHSNIVPWQILCEDTGCILKIAPINDKGEIDFDAYLKLLSPKTKIVSVVHVSNALGTINPIKRIIAAAHKQGAVTVIDGAQATNALRIDVQDLGCDFYVFSGHKMFGPTGTGVLYGKKELLNELPPYQSGGDMIANVTFDKTIYNDLPYKFEAGTPNIAGIIGLGAAVDYLNEIDWKEMRAHKKELLNYGTQELTKIKGLRLIGTAKEKTSILSFVLKDIHPHDIGSIVDEEGVAIRTGHHCTQPVMQRFNIPATARASLAFYNTKKEIDVLVKAIKKVIEIFK